MVEVREPTWEPNSSLQKNFTHNKRMCVCNAAPGAGVVISRVREEAKAPDPRPQTLRAPRATKVFSAMSPESLHSLFLICL